MPLEWDELVRPILGGSIGTGSRRIFHGGMVLSFLASEPNTIKNRIIPSRPVP
uniref:Uncharacterized protein n=1 Tax=Arundo donax TaxID=35708 RepID=A0A0A9G109_ARUDO